MEDTQQTAFERYWQSTGVNYGVGAMQMALREIAENAWNSAVEQSADVAEEYEYGAGYGEPEMISASRDINQRILKLQSNKA